MKFIIEENGSLVIELTQSEGKTLADRFISMREDAQTAVLILLPDHEARFGAVNIFRQPPHPWEALDAIPVRNRSFF